MAYITLKRSALFHNLDIITQECGSKDKIALVLKDNAYGHGLLEIAKLAYEYGITKAVVRNVNEAELISDYFEYILILADITPCKNPKFCYTINTLEDIKKIHVNCRVELKIDSGMHRSGLKEEELAEAFKQIKERGLKLEALFSHHRSADTLSSEWFWQKKNFQRIKNSARKLHDDTLRFHLNNSAALFREGTCEDEMVRVGIAAYGCLELDKTLNRPNLQPVLSLYAKKLLQRNLHVNERIGYNGTYCAKNEQQIATYDIGYADGFMRCTSKYTTPSGAEVLGRISMDNTSFSSIEDDLLIFSDARELAKTTSTISYEVLTSLKPHLKRKII
ncbi:MAG: alanine racemase [Campylobacterota bacterium]|nr:alanine racemase [Campylobacterota bacterium]